MELTDYLLAQVLQPFFFYSVLLLAIAFATAYALLRINDHLGGRWKSIMMVIPLLAPPLVFCTFTPSLTVSFAGLGLTGQPPFPGGPPEATLPLIPFPAMAPLNGHPIDGMFSVTGALVLIGAALSILCLLLSAVFRGRVAEKLLRIVPMGPEDYPELQRGVRELAGSMGIGVPKLGLVEDLRPNAFTVGWGRGTLVVFSLGLLMMLDEDELRAVSAHELAHLKNHDIAFKTLATSLAWLSFFNPLAFMALYASRRERENMADEEARSALGDGGALARAIAKVASVLEGTDSRPVAGWSFGPALSLVDGASTFSAHPSFADRAERMTGPFSQGRSVRSLAGCILMSAAVIFLAMLLLMNLGEIRAEIVQSIVDIPPAPMFEAGGPYGMACEGPHVPRAMGTHGGPYLDHMELRNAPHEGMPWS